MLGPILGTTSLSLASACSGVDAEAARAKRPPDPLFHRSARTGHLPTASQGTGARPSWLERTTDTLIADHAAFYDTGTMLGLGVGIGLAGISANLQLDRDISEDVLPEWQTAEWTEFRDSILPVGDGTYVFPTLAAAALVAPMLGSDAIGEWGERSLRAILVGVPPVLALQRLTGAGRPDDPGNKTSSEWQPFKYSNGVSGHAFVGAVPFLTIASMQDSPWIDGACYVGSTIVAGARLQGSRHYFSQVVLGWWIAYLSVGAVADSAMAGAQPSATIQPLLDPDGGVGLAVTHRF